MGQKHRGAKSGGATGSASDRGSQMNTIKGGDPSRKLTAARNAAHPTTPTKPALKVHPRQGPIRDEMHD